VPIGICRKYFPLCKFRRFRSSKLKGFVKEIKFAHTLTKIVFFYINYISCRSDGKFILHGAILHPTKTRNSTESSSAITAIFHPQTVNTLSSPSTHALISELLQLDHFDSIFVYDGPGTGKSTGVASEATFSSAAITATRFAAQQTKIPITDLIHVGIASGSFFAIHAAAGCGGARSFLFVNPISSMRKVVERVFVILRQYLCSILRNKLDVINEISNLPDDSLPPRAIILYTEENWGGGFYSSAGLIDVNDGIEICEALNARGSSCEMRTQGKTMKDAMEGFLNHV
jgi:hypothetical protein